jgi:hypothetical protein
LQPGGGNAVVRPYQCQEPPRAIGIPTGSHGQGYATLSEQVRQTIDEAFLGIQKLLATGRYRRLYYSSADTEGNLGTGIFDVDEDVKRYISEKVRSLNVS